MVAFFYKIIQISRECVFVDKQRTFVVFLTVYSCVDCIYMFVCLCWINLACLMLFQCFSVEVLVSKRRGNSLSRLADFAHDPVGKVLEQI